MSPEYPWTRRPRMQLACLDMAGTTVGDDGLVERAAATAIEGCGLAPDDAAHAAALEIVRRTMGQSKISVFQRIFPEPDQASQANLLFEKAYADLVAAGEVSALPGAADAMSSLRAMGVRVVLTTGFGRSTQDAIIEALGWRQLVDLAVVPGDGLRGRPSPDLVWHAAMRLGIEDSRAIAVAGDSVSDMGCGVRAGAGIVAGILHGAHSGEALDAAGATHLLDDVGGLVELVA